MCLNLGQKIILKISHHIPIKKSIWIYGTLTHYDLSAAFYVDGFKNVIGDDFDFFIIAIESKEPHNFAVYKLSDAILDFGRGKVSTDVPSSP